MRAQARTINDVDVLEWVTWIDKCNAYDYYLFDWSSKKLRTHMHFDEAFLIRTSQNRRFFYGAAW